jgi:hypothetical protein
MDRVTLVLPVLITLFVNSIAIYGILLGQYYYYLNSPQFSHFDQHTLELFIKGATLGNVVLIIGTSVWMIIIFWRKGKFVFAAPITTGISVVMMIIIGYAQSDSYSEYAKDGFMYREEIWRLGNKVDKFKRWKSADSCNKPDIGKKIVWELDSVNDN